MVEAGMSHKDIADHVLSETGVVVSRSTVSAALSRAGLTTTSQRYRDELPWRVQAEHLTQYPARMLRLLGRQRAGITLTDDELDRLEAWMESLTDKGLVVAYAPENDGFIYVYADEFGDGSDGVPIRKRVIHPDEIVE